MKFYCCEYCIMEVLTKARKLGNKWHFKPLSLPQPHVFCTMDIFLRFLVFQMLYLLWKQGECISMGGAKWCYYNAEKKSIYSVACNLFHGW